jgi:plasmid replication initiation protein
MPLTRIPLKSREAFAALSLHEKNDYLQDVAKQMAKADGQEFSSLDKDALSRLRRYYSRRSMADLKLEEVTDGGLRGVLTRLADSIRAEEILKVLDHEVSSPRTPNAAKPRSLTREAPADDAQLMFFVPRIHDAPIKDDFNLMDIAPFALSKTTGEGIIRYELKDSIITIEGGAEVGLATAYDYDIVINMISHLAEATRQYKIDEQKGRRPSLPPQVYRPAAAEILKFCRRELGGKQYEDLERALDRLQATRIKITNLNGKSPAGQGGRPGKPDKLGRRETESFPLIGRYKVIARTSQDRIDQIEIEIPNWVYQGVVRPDGKPSILTLSPDYFLITRPIAKFLYRLARKAAGETEARYSLTELHKRSGSKLPKHKFKQAIEEIVEAAKTAPQFPDYDLSLEQGKQEMILRMRSRSAPQALQAPTVTDQPSEPAAADI